MLVSVDAGSKQFHKESEGIHWVKVPQQNIPSCPASIVTVLPALSALMLGLAVGYTVPHPSCVSCQVQHKLQPADLLVDLLYQVLLQVPCLVCDCLLHGWQTQDAVNLCSAVPQ